MHHERKNEESRMTSSFLAWATRRIELLLAELGKSKFGEEQELCCWHADFEMPSR